MAKLKKMIKWIEHIFKSDKTALNKPIVSGTFAKISDVLTDKQKNGAFLYYLNHKEHIENIMSETNKAYEPSQSEDKNDPRIWKAEYWKWFLANCN